MEKAVKKLKLTRKHVAFLTIILVVGITVFMVYQAFSNEKNYVQIYDDQQLTRSISFQDPSVFSDFQLGWNNKTVWIKNVGDKPVEIVLSGVLPKDWRIIWSYDGSLVNPQETVEVTISIYAAHPTSILMFPINFEYRVVEG